MAATVDQALLATEGRNSPKTDLENLGEKKEEYAYGSARRLAQKYTDFPRITPSSKKNPKTKQELKREKERVRQERTRISEYRYQALEEMKARKTQAAERFKVCNDRIQAADRKKEHNQKVREEREAHYKMELEAINKQFEITKRETEVRVHEIDRIEVDNLNTITSSMSAILERKTDNIFFDLRILLDARKQDLELAAKSHDERLERLEEWVKLTGEAMRSKYDQTVKQKTSHFDSRKQLQEIESDIQFLESVLKDLQRRSNVVKELQSVLKG